MIKLKRVYDPPDRRDGKRVLVDRLWPRGITKEDAAVDLWLREIAPSNELRKWFGHDPGRWQEFRKRYRTELEEKADLVHELSNAARKGTVTLLYSAKDTEHNNAVVLRELIAS
jgi:uncharacterized protein YeaO (DUF488 family)